MPRRNPDGWVHSTLKGHGLKNHAVRVYTDEGPPKWFYYSTAEEAIARGPYLCARYGKRKPSMSVANFLYQWCDGRDGEVSPTTLGIYRSYVKDDIEETSLGRLSLAAVEARDVRDWVNVALKRPSRRPGATRTIGRARVRHALYMLRQAFDTAEIDKLLTHNPARKVRGPHMRTVAHRSLTVNQQMRLFATLLADEDAPLWWCYGVLGRRRGEVLGMWSSEYLPRDAAVETRRCLVRGGPRWQTTPGKPRANVQQSVPVYLRQLLDRELARRAMRQAMAGDNWIETPFLFTTGRGTPRDPNDVRRRFVNLLQHAGLPPLTIHDLRRLCASMALEEAADLRQVQAYVGWSSLQMAAHYADVPMSTLARVGQSVEARARALAGAGGFGVSNGVSYVAPGRDVADSGPETEIREANRNGEPSCPTLRVMSLKTKHPARPLRSMAGNGVPNAVHAVSRRGTGCHVVGCQDWCQAPVSRGKGTSILVEAWPDPILGPALTRALRVAESRLVWKQMRVAIAKFIRWCAIHGFDPAFADERHLWEAFCSLDISETYRNQLRCYARRLLRAIDVHPTRARA